MAGNRKKAEAFIFDFIKKFDPSGYNTEQYKKIFAKMSDKQFDDYMKGIRDGSKGLVAFKPMYKAKDITVENNFKIAEDYGLKFFERLVHTNTPEGVDFTTPIEYLVLTLPYRRQSQTLVKKVSIPDDNKVIDSLTYQPTGSSKGSKISYPELQVMMGMGLDHSITELIRFRGGDKSGFNAYNAMFARYGEANLKTLENFSSGVESTKTLKSFLLGMHISANL